MRLALSLALALGVLAQARVVRGEVDPTAKSRFGGKLTSCRVPGVENEALCGRYEVFENRSARTGRKIGLNLVVLPARGPEVAPDALFFLAGGGVAPATRYAGFLSEAYANLRGQHDIVLVDQRGTGGSNPLECDVPTEPSSAVYRDEARFRAAVRHCRSELEPKADLRHYTTPIAMDDLDEVRSWLGYPRIDLYGVSYGTTAAMVYLRQHPEHVRAIALQGVIPFDAPMWLEVPRSSQQVLEQVFAECARQPACHSAFPDFEAELRALAKRLAEKPVRVHVKLETGEQEVTIDDEILRTFVSRTLSSASRIHDLPLLVHLAHQGDYRWLAARVAPHEDRSIPKGVYLSLVCSENIPQFEPRSLPAAAAGTFTGGFRVGRDVVACQEWVRGRLPSGFFAPVHSNVPVLILNGALDHLTPPRYGERVSRSLANALRLVLPERGHNDVDPCVSGIVEAFLTAGQLSGLDTSCLARTPELSFALRTEELVN